MYLTESSLAACLSHLYPDSIWLHDKPICGSRFRPDYYCEELKLVVEFDGYQHYTSSKQISNDTKKDTIYQLSGIKVIHIPYFIQLDKQITELFFGQVFAFSDYPHGFIDKKALLPADFCWLGIKRFEKDLERFACVKDKIIDSLKDKMILYKDRSLVIPEVLDYLLT
jgi:hypothetical protein